ncbi:MAG: DNA methyltransferase [Armatimonadota bacterium]|nr:DNA methyltransferase [Armatimonadota bacterium]
MQTSLPLDDDGPDREPQERKQPGRRARRNTLNDLTGREWIKATKSWLVCDSRRYHQNRDTELHPARYPEELVAQFLRFFTKRGGWVLDPLCGSGATLVAALEEGRNAVGVEISPRYVEMTRQRLAGTPGDGVDARVIEADARGLARDETWAGEDGLPWGEEGLPQFDFIMTSPPYWKMLRTSRGGVHSTHKQRADEGLDTDYGDVEGNLGLIEDYERFVDEVGGVFDACAKLLRPGKYLVVVAQNVRVPDGYVRPLAWDLARRISRSLSFQGERIWCQDSKQLGIWGYPTTFVPNYHHHYCLIFRRQD